MKCRPGPRKAVELRRNVAHLLRRNEPTIGAAGEARTLWSDERTAHRRKDAVGRDQHIGLDLGAVLELHAHGLAVLFDADAAVREMDALGRHGISQQRMQFAAMEDHVRRAELLLDVRGKPRLGQRAAIVPAALMEERRAERHPGAFLAKAKPDQDARCIRADVDAGADLAEQARLLVHLYVEAGLQQADRGGESADAAADDGDPDVFGRHHATRLPRTWS